MRALIFFVALSITSLFFTNSPQRAKTDIQPTRLFDEYRLIRWEDEKARLDNFAVALTNEPDSIGYIFVYDGMDICAGEAEARALRAKRYIVEHRGVPWDRVIWRRDGYNGQFEIILEPIRRDVAVPYPFRRLAVDGHLVETHLNKNCATRMAAIKKSTFKN
ncbi:MAG: hypothetical protein DMF70_02215 [Acidobacteria bacterium]|nr:MAG: hypothetical protein DMF70_02215 [Acidobacteriota bacterium]